MEKPHKKFSELVEKMKSWSSRRSEPANISRDFWMPDGSCRVCYECDSQFTVFNRRHHCRLCGRIFCAKCTSNFVLVPLVNSPNIEEEGDHRIRVCNYCFKQWEQEVGASSNCLSVSSPVLSPSLSTTSSTSSKSSGTVNSNITTAGLTPYTSGAYDSMLNNSGHSLITSLHNEPMTGQPDKVVTERNMDSIAGVEHHTHNDCGFSLNRIVCNVVRLDSRNRQSNNLGEFVEKDFGHGKLECFERCMNPLVTFGDDASSSKNYDAQAKFSSISIDTEVHGSLEKEKAGKEAQNHSNYECSNSSGMHHLENAEKEQVDFEKNICLWLPPDPENEEDEKESSLVDDDGEDAIGEWGYLQSSNFCGGEYQTKSRSSEEHKKAMKNVVDGHFRVLVAQLLQVENLPVTDDHEKDGWLDIISSLSWEAASLLKPDTSKGGGMDPGGYVKVKCIAYGSRKESMVIKGVVCKKNVAHRRMSSRVDKPRLLILGGALEYQRVTNLLSSFDTLLQQEMDHLKMAVAKIDAHHPNVLLVEKSVSRFAQDYLLAKNISLVLNVKRPLLERIARCTGAQIVPSVDHMSSPKLGHCDLFHVEKYLEEHGSAGQNGKKLMKTLMFFEGCPKPLGCTRIIMAQMQNCNDGNKYDTEYLCNDEKSTSGNGDELKRVKHVIQYGVFAAYHLALETSFLADEGASLPELPLKSPITVALPDKPSTTNKSISTIPGFTFRSGVKPCCTGDTESPGPTPDPVDVSIDRNGCVSGRNQQFEQFNERHSAHSINLTLQDIFSGFRDVIKDVCHHHWDTEGHGRVDELDHIDAEAVRTNNDVVNNGDTSLPNCQRSTAVSELGWIMTNDTQTDKTKIFGKQPGSVDFWTAHQDNNDRNEYSSSVEHFSPSSDHQSILSYRCRSCEMPSEAHVQCYTHRQGSLTISVKKLTEFLLPGERDGKIWMWHRCLRCPRIDGFPPATRRVVMSDAAWGLSFGKFLELSFSNHAAASRVANCGHSLHRDCLRFYGYLLGSFSHVRNYFLPTCMGIYWSLPHFHV
ncbi:1-phosphatidylinositol-3-phosphate 5-kinase FAB1B [Apostasia shenzhenica]|uniref:Phosphatidylinositol 3-phosphate 5-kinase type III n=1 Tax=Apostasia shenzhenica TaxID=1088818 RepID=A0A2I0BBI1_9ASPA|nr:1-phosphatidylinositol-3-phosphate 5-kinase FAB1B [Apostasia shenzhenica]